MSSIENVLNYIFQFEQLDFEENECPENHVYAFALKAEKELHATLKALDLASRALRTAHLASLEAMDDLRQREFRDAIDAIDAAILKARGA